ncbi:hypothetical protein [Ectothiorhodospira marina]|jgi:hypothetical protein|uniref:Lipoprotein n=1 Tax=Ectothiorhodospira marina TaxID=1396821 RepID=A0A1H7P5F9_9GAMM|nr:hypothetical protein [Ectothiorhodospira marina]SEL30578.1 hypothetical protein SAMN05444515_11346 [Ectothiorhodospira marina]
MTRTSSLLLAGLVASIVATGCQTGPSHEGVDADGQQASAQNASYDKPGFHTEVEDGRLWVLRPGQEKSEKHATLIAAGPEGMSVKALDRETALEYVATKPGFEVKMVEGRLWILKPGQEMSEKHVTRIAAGPQRTTLKALDNETMEEYLAQ